MKNVLVPLWRIPYYEQLQLKSQLVSEMVSKYYAVLQEDFSKPNTKRLVQLPPKPEIREICPSPVLYHYRTRDTYCVRPGLDGNPKTVGFAVALKSWDKYVCVPPSDIISPPQHVQVAKAFQDFIRLSPLPAYFQKKGNWSELQVRSNVDGDTQALVRMHPQELTQHQIEDECVRLRDYFKSGPGSDLQLSSLHFHPRPFKSSHWPKVVPYRQLFGDKHLIEKLSGLSFALSPGSFFQSNRNVAEIMYEKVITAANLSSTTSVLDLGCGIGTISILLASHVKETVGIDVVQNAVEDARFNASLNNIRSANFISGTIEKEINLALQWVQPSKDVVAVLNPGRCGVHVSLIKQLRESCQINKVIYISCDPDHTVVIRDVVALIKPEGRKALGTPFLFKSVTPFDMFPQTAHCELVMVFERQ